jgi:hypothetical protein
MPVYESENDCNAPHTPSETTPMKSSCNFRAGHGKLEVETELEKEESDLEQECYKPEWKKKNYNGWLDYEVQEIWTTGEEATLERADIENQILQSMAKFMTDSQFLKSPGHKPKKTDIHLWKLHSKEYYSKRSDEHICCYKCPMFRHCNCMVQIVRW